MKTNRGFVVSCVLLFASVGCFFSFFSPKGNSRFKWELIWGNFAARFKPDDHTGFTALITHESIPLCKAPYSKTVYPELYSSPLLSILLSPKAWQEDTGVCSPPAMLKHHIHRPQHQCGATSCWLGTCGCLLLATGACWDPPPPTQRTCPRHHLLWSLSSLFLSQSESKDEEICRLASPNTLPLCIWNSSFSLNNILYEPREGVHLPFI